MAIDESRRHELHEAARQSLGAAAGDALMELLPPVGWGDVTRTSDVDRLRVEFHRLEASVKRDLEVQTIELRAMVIEAVSGAEHRILLWLFTTVLAGIAISVSAATAVALAV